MCYINSDIVGIKEQGILFFIGKVKELNKLYSPYDTDINISNVESIILLKVFVPSSGYNKIKKLLTTPFVSSILQECMVRAYSYEDLVNKKYYEYSKVYTIGLNILKENG